MREQPRMSPNDWALLLFLSLLWGGAFFFSKVALQALPPFVLVLARVGVAALALGVYVRLQGMVVPWSPSLCAAFAGMGLLNNLIPFSLLCWGQTTIASGLASVLNATTPIFALLVAHAATADEKLSVSKLAGIALGFAGVVVLVGNDAMSGPGRPVLAMLACLGAALSYGVASVFGKRFRQMGISPTVGAFGQVSASTIMMLPVVLIFDAPWRLAAPAMPVCAAVLALGVASTALAYVIYFHLIARAGGTNASLVGLLIPASAVCLGGAFLGERLATSQFLGMVLIGLGLIAIDGRFFGSMRRLVAS